MMLVFEPIEEAHMHKKLVLAQANGCDDCIFCCMAEQLIAEEWGLA